jgi:homocysteine S-methyltransferase
MALGHDRETAEKLLLRTVELAEQAREQFLAQNEVDFQPMIAASIGPYGAYLADGSEYRGDYKISEADLHTFHQERIQILDQTPADLFACETIPSFAEAKVLADILEDINKPAWISFSCRDERHINDGTPIREAAARFADHPRVFAVGVNCTAPKYISSLIQNLRPTIGDKKILVYPNSGESYHVASKTWLGTSDPEAFVRMAREWKALGADILGGCCRIGPAHIRKLKAIL